MRIRFATFMTVSLLGLSVLSAAGQERPSGNKPPLGVFADSVKATIPGLDISQLPREAQALLEGQLGAQHMLRVHLWTPGGTAPASDVREGEGPR